MPLLLSPQTILLESAPLALQAALESMQIRGLLPHQCYALLIFDRELLSAMNWLSLQSSWGHWTGFLSRRLRRTACALSATAPQRYACM